MSNNELNNKFQKINKNFRNIKFEDKNQRTQNDFIEYAEPVNQLKTQFEQLYNSLEWVNWRLENLDYKNDQIYKKQQKIFYLNILIIFCMVGFFIYTRFNIIVFDR